MSFYDILSVDHNASLEEIKLAFKRRALQVHPDKGGSKEAFHSVYEALQTLTDPSLRKRYDARLAGEATPMPKKAKAKAKRSRGKAGDFGSPKFAPKPKVSTTKRSGGPKSAFNASESRQNKLLAKIHGLLKQLPLETRNDIIQKQFSEKQRLILEKWMVDTFSPKGMPLGDDRCTSAPSHTAKDGSLATHDSESWAVALAPLKATPATPVPMKGAKNNQKNNLGSRKQDLTQARQCGCIKKNRSNGKGGSYKAKVRFDAIYIEMFSAKCDLPTALEYLVILTAVKQKMMEESGTPGIFAERLRETLISCVREHGKVYADLDLRFGVTQAAGMFVGRELRSPAVRSIAGLEKLRSILAPFRKCGRNNWGRRGLFQLYSPETFQREWLRFQSAIAETWRTAGTDSDSILRKIHGLYEANSGLRENHLQAWELKHMALEDRCPQMCRAINRENKKNKKKRLADLRRAIQRERRSMAMQDKNKHRPRKWRVRQSRSGPEVVQRKSLLLTKLLVRWSHWLKRENMKAEKEHRRLHRQLKKKREAHKRWQAGERKRAREEERARREALRKRMRCQD